ncbi:ABC transporter substrate-binding protein, partial [Streptomyces sp. SID10244]|nr:ABC transporter substrate-binding protein [Streptomyces sp. SID10244]
YTGDAPFINALAAGAKISAISATKASGANGLAIIVPQNSPIHSVADLRGKTVSPTTQGSIGHYELLAALKEASVSAQDTTISFLDPVNAAAAFKSGDIDAWSTWDPYTAVAQVEDHARIIR